MSLPVNLQADLDQNEAAIRDLLDRTEIVEAMRDERLSALLGHWGKLIAANIFGAGGEYEMNLRALAWIETFGGLE